MFARRSEAVITRQFVFTARAESRGKRKPCWMIICDILGRTRLSVSASRPTVRLPWKQGRFSFWMVNYSNCFWCNISIFAGCWQSLFLLTSEGKISSQPLYIRIRKIQFASGDASSPDDIYITCVAGLNHYWCLSTRFLVGVEWKTRTNARQ